MNAAKNRIASRWMAAFACFLLAFAAVAPPAIAQSILRDAETEALFRDLSAPLIRAAGLDPANVDVVLINDPSINAFVAGGQVVYVHSGLIASSDNANQLQGVIAHELGHIAGGHIVRHSDGVKSATGITILSLLLGVAAAAAGSGDAAMGIISAGQQAALGKYLAFSRTQESSADMAGAQYLGAAGISGKGSIDFFKKLQNQEFRLAIAQDDSYDRTHPLSGERITVLQDVYAADPAWNAVTEPALEARFQRVKAKLLGFVAEPRITMQAYPQTMQSVPARYARAYGYHKQAYPDRALAEVDSLLAESPDDPYFLELKGQVLLESGRPFDAIAPLRRATTLTNNQPLIAGLFGHALIATEDATHFGEAETVLRAAVSRDRENPFAWYQLGVVFAARGDMPRAQLASAEQQVMSRQMPLALRSAEEALAGLPTGSPDWLRAQDISFQARAEIERAGNRR